jgi:hypothetical protein
MSLRALTNVRPDKDLGAKFTVSCVQGQMKVTPDTAKRVGVSDASYMSVVTDDTTKKSYIFKGSEDGLGGKLASSNKGGGGVLTFSAAAAWGELDGDEGFNRQYAVAEESVKAETLVEEGEDLGALAGKDLFEIIFEEAIAKTARKRKVKTANTGDIEPFADVVTEESVAETPTESATEEAEDDDFDAL